MISHALRPPVLFAELATQQGSTGTCKRFHFAELSLISGLGWFQQKEPGNKHMNDHNSELQSVQSAFGQVLGRA